MRLDRYENHDDTGKYALVHMRRADRSDPEIDMAMSLLEQKGVLDFGKIGTEGEFFVVMLKDRHARPALRAYANSALSADREYGMDVSELAERSGVGSQFCKDPD